MAQSQDQTSCKQKKLSRAAKSKTMQARRNGSMMPPPSSGRDDRKGGMTSKFSFNPIDFGCGKRQGVVSTLQAPPFGSALHKATQRSCEFDRLFVRRCIPFADRKTRGMPFDAKRKIKAQMDIGTKHDEGA